jgi:thymidylate kinase
MAKLCPKLILEGTRLTGKTELAFDLNGLINFEESETGLAMATFDTWARLFEQLRYYSWIVDRFHLSTRVWQAMHRDRTIDFGWLEDRLAAVGFRIVLCIRQTETFESARAERLEVSANPTQYDDLSVFVREQRMFEEAADRSSLPLLRLDVSDGDRARMCEEIAEWLGATGGLYADY